jgi:chemotaxis protein methyltransferase CheR
MSSQHQISQQDYDEFKSFLEKSSGILLGDGKQYLIVSRLNKILREEGFESVTKLLLAVKRDYPKHIQSAVIDAMTTNETSWFRDQTPFNALTHIVFPELERTKKLALRIWSSASSTGQEPYTISISLQEYLKKNPMSRLKASQILGTDLSSSVLAEATKAEYDDRILGRGLTEQRKKEFFVPVENGWRVADEIRKRVTFKQQNLLANYAGLGKFDIIFCRNVLIYFSHERKKDILKRMAKLLNTDGYLFLGASETITGYSDDFEMIRSPHGVFYKLRN